jgi:hypothetical protein
MDSVKKEFLPPSSSTSPTINAYEMVGVPTQKSLIKFGYTDRGEKKRIKEQLGTAAIPFKIVFEESAMKKDGSSFTDHDILRHLRKQNCAKLHGEWYKSYVIPIFKSIWKIKTDKHSYTNRTLTIRKRPVQLKAVKKSHVYFNTSQKEYPDKAIISFEKLKDALGASFSRELNDLLFSYPYIKIGVLEESGIAKRQTASQYLQKIEKSGWLHSFKVGRDVYYTNHKLIDILSQ